VECPSLDSSPTMADWFSRRSGSRVSTHNPVRRRVLQAPSLSINPMPLRTTRKSDRRKVSDRTMVGIAQPLCLFALGTGRRRYDSTMNLRKRKFHRVSLRHWGWTASTLCFAAAEQAFVLTSPFIERGYREVANLRCGVSRVMREFSNKFLTCRQANLALQEPLLIVLVEDSLLEVGPKFLESIDRHASGETFRRAEKCVLHVGFAMNAPGIR
jgi:hypothetical protein